MASFPGWQQALLRRIGAPATSENLRFLNAWTRAEGGSASFNPLNTTQGAPGASDYNSVHVRNYRSAQQGTNATAQTLINGHYNNLVNMLRSGRASARQLASAEAKTPWGTGAGILRVLGSGPVAVPELQQAASNLAQGNLSAPPVEHQTNTRNALLQFVMANNTALAQGSFANPMDYLQGAQGVQNAIQTLSQPKTPLPLVHGSASDKANHALNTAEKYLGTWYKWGGSSPSSGFDCSGLLQYAWRQSGVNIPRTTYDQWKVGKAVGRAGLQPGDAVFFKGSDSRGGLPGHVGMYLGGGKMVVAPHTGAKVQIQNISAVPGYMGARRYA